MINVIITDKGRAVVGGGVYLEFIYYGGIFLFDVNFIVLDEYDINSIFSFFNCIFINNSVFN